MVEKLELEVDEVRRLQFAAAVRKHLSVKGLSRKALIRNDLSDSTIDKALSGTKLSQATIDKMEAILGTKFDIDKTASAGDSVRAVSQKAPDSLGNYTLSAVEHLEGDYLFVRPTFKNPAIIAAYQIEIRWDTKESCLVFSETGRSDAKYAQSGKVYVPFGRPFLNFLTITTGGVRLMVVSMPDNENTMRGIITTIHNPSGSNYVPASAPVAMVKMTVSSSDKFGQITPDDPNYLPYKKLLDEVVAEQYGVMVSGVELAERRRGLSVVNS